MCGWVAGHGPALIELKAVGSVRAHQATIFSSPRDDLTKQHPLPETIQVKTTFD